MSDETSLSLNTNDLVFWVTELRAGRPNAAESTFRKIVAKVEQFARTTFKRFPRVGRFVDAEDVIQGTLIRLLAALREVRPTSRQHFYALANELIRRELLDLTKHFYGPRGHGTHVGGVAVGEAEGEHAPAAPDAAAELDRLAAFHEAVAELPVEEREVVALTYYHGWTQTQIADLFQVSVRTVQRWHESATATLKGRIGDRVG
jgi:RNA polymerase sigma-70 factor (ECF subfamily)